MATAARTVSEIFRKDEYKSVLQLRTETVFLTYCPST